MVVEQSASGGLSEQEVIESLWLLFYERLKMVVRGKVRSIKHPVANESEIALSAFQGLVQHLRERALPEIIDHNEMWHLLKRIALRKTNHTKRFLLAKRRGGERRIFNQADFVDRCRQSSDVGSLRVGRSFRNDEVDAIDWFDALLSRLPDDRHRDAIVLKLEGRTACEIAELLHISTRTVKRILSRIEQLWLEEFSD
jgi:hypothetical protein